MEGDRKKVLVLNIKGLIYWQDSTMPPKEALGDICAERENSTASLLAKVWFYMI